MISIVVLSTVVLMLSAGITQWWIIVPVAVAELVFLVWLTDRGEKRRKQQMQDAFFARKAREEALRQAQEKDRAEAVRKAQERRMQREAEKKAMAAQEPEYEKKDRRSLALRLAKARQAYTPDILPPDLYKLKEEEGWILINREGSLLTQARFEEIGSYHDGALAVKRNGKWGFVNPFGREIIPCVWDAVAPVQGNQAWVRKDGKWGSVDLRGNILIPCQFRNRPYLEHGLIKGTRSGHGKYGVTDACGNEIIPFQWDAISIRSGCILLNQGQFWYVSNHAGIQKPGLCYDGYALLSGTHIAVCKDGKWGILDRDEERIPCQWDEVRLHGYSYLSWQKASVINVRLGEKWGILGWDNRLILPCRFRRIRQGEVLLGEEWISLDENYRLKPRPDVDIYPAGWKRVRDRSGLYGYVNRKKTAALPALWEDACIFNEDMAAVCKDGKWGYLDRKGKLVIPCQWDLALKFQESMAPVEREGKWTYLRRDGTPVTDRFFDCARPFRKGKAHVRLDGRWGWLYKDGSLQWE